MVIIWPKIMFLPLMVIKNGMNLELGSFFSSFSFFLICSLVRCLVMFCLGSGLCATFCNPVANSTIKSPQTC